MEYDMLHPFSRNLLFHVVLRDEITQHMLGETFCILSVATLLPLLQNVSSQNDTERHMVQEVPWNDMLLAFSRQLLFYVGLRNEFMQHMVGEV